MTTLLGMLQIGTPVILARARSLGQIGLQQLATKLPGPLPVVCRLQMLRPRPRKLWTVLVSVGIPVDVV